MTSAIPDGAHGRAPEGAAARRDGECGMNSGFLPITAEEIRRSGRSGVDVVLVTGDAYVDHPSYGAAVIGRLLERAGFTVALLCQPDWRSKDAFLTFGRPNLFFGITSGNMDSMVNKYTSLRKIRNRDAYSEGGRPFMRPDRATIVYSQRAREAYGDVPIILGGVEASLRRFAHYDYWSDSVRRSVILDARADLLVYGMGERQVLEIARRLHRGEKAEEIRDVRGTAYCTRGNEPFDGTDSRLLPSFEEVRGDPAEFNRATMMIHEETNPYNAKTLVQYHGGRAVVVLPPALPLSENEIDDVYALPFTRRPHPAYREPIPACEMIQNSVTIHRGCFGGCSFCSIALHQGKIVQSRSAGSVLAELGRMSGNVSDLGGPSANMYSLGCGNRKALLSCRKLSCLHPSPCRNLVTDHGPLIDLMRKARAVPGIRHVFVSSGIRMDLAVLHPEYIEELAAHHVSGHLKVAPEHSSRRVLDLMKKPRSEIFDAFLSLFTAFSKKAGKRQYVVPYIISSHPGARMEDEIDLALFLKERGFRPRQIQDFLPSPLDIATAMYHTGLDPSTGARIHAATGEREKRIHRAIIQYFTRENRALLRRSLSRGSISRSLSPNAGPAAPAKQNAGAGRENRRRTRVRQTHADRLRRLLE
jgi:uncharacterized radical SAM protein YgiQ